MSEILIDLPANDPSYIGQLLYAMHFCDSSVANFSVAQGVLKIQLHPDADAAVVRGKAERIAKRYAEHRDLFEQQLDWQTGPLAIPPRDVFPEMVEQGLVHVEGRGRVALRGLAALVHEAVDQEVLARIAPLGLGREVYSGTMGCDDMARTQHISSFPQHLLFVSHLREDIDVIDEFTRHVRAQGGWSTETAHAAHAAAQAPKVVLNPAVCYHCYVGLRGKDLKGKNHGVTARSRCHRYESGNLTDMRRLADFDMREVIFVGEPDWVKAMRRKAEEVTKAMLEDWEMDAALVSANDPFFSDDYEVKAPLQRRQEMKMEVVIRLSEGGQLAIASSNFHTTTFGKAFDIKLGKRPACSGCFGWGLDRITYAIFLRHGTDPSSWPKNLIKRIALVRDFS